NRSDAGDPLRWRTIRAELHSGAGTRLLAQGMRVEIRHGLHPEAISGGMLGGSIEHEISCNIAAFRTPRPWTFMIEAGLLARESAHPSGLPTTLAGRSGASGQMLTAYSCGGSSGFASPLRRNAPHSRLSVQPYESDEPRT